MGINSVGQPWIWLNAVRQLSLPPSRLAVYACSDEISPGFALRPLMLILSGAFPLSWSCYGSGFPSHVPAGGWLGRKSVFPAKQAAIPDICCLPVFLSCFTFGVAGNQNLSWCVAGGCSGLGRVYPLDYWHSRKIRGIWCQLPADQRGLTVLPNCKNALNDVFPSSIRCQHAK